MKIKEVRTRAKKKEVKANGSKADVIRRIQQAEGNEPCFGNKDNCDQVECCWQDDCPPSVQCC